MDVATKLSTAEEEIIWHSLGGKNKIPYRNRFVTGEGSADFPIVEGLVSKRMMIKRRYSLNELEIEFIYYVTELGTKAVGLNLPDRLFKFWGMKGGE